MVRLTKPEAGGIFPSIVRNQGEAGERTEFPLNPNSGAKAANKKELNNDTRRTGNLANLPCFSSGNASELHRTNEY